MDHELIDPLLRAGCLNYQGDDGPATRAKARALLQTDPSLADANIFVASMSGRSRRVAELLRDDPALAVASGGPRGWPPLLYLCYGRVHAMREGESAVAVAEALLDAGADPNARWLWEETYAFTALTGCFGEGEGGPVALPEHPEATELAKLLLARGADPNDGQALYNRMFTPGCTCLRVLLEGGLRPNHRINWPVAEQPQQTTMSYQLYHAARHGFLDRVELLLEHAVDLEEREPGGDSVWRAAALCGESELCARLETEGVPAEAVDAVDTFVANFRRGDIELVRAALAEDAALLEPAESKHGSLLSHALNAGDLPAINLLVRLGVELDRDPNNPAAHQAAWSGRVETLKLVLEHGADPELRDARFGATALGWAEHNGQAETAAYLRARGLL